MRPAADDDRPWILELVRTWGADFVVTRGRKVFPTELDAFIALNEAGGRVGLVTYEIIDDKCEVVTLDALEKFEGIGTALLKTVKKDAILRGCRRLWLITTNDNLPALRFYQRYGFVFNAVRPGTVDVSRMVKHNIATVGVDGIPIHDELELELKLA